MIAFARHVYCLFFCYCLKVVSPALFWIQVTTSPDKDMKWMSDRIGEIIAPPKRQVSDVNHAQNTFLVDLVSLLLS